MGTTPKVIRHLSEDHSKCELSLSLLSQSCSVAKADSRVLTSVPRGGPLGAICGGPGSQVRAPIASVRLARLIPHSQVFVTGSRPQADVQACESRVGVGTHHVEF